MPDEFDVPPPIRQFVQDFAKVLASLPIEPPPPGIVEALRIFQGRLEGVRAAMDQMAAFNSVAGIQARQQAAVAQMALSFAATHQVPVPTAGELAETDEALRTRILPETSQEELQEAASEVIRDPEKLELIALLKWAIDQATGVPGSSLWVVFVFAFYVCVKMHADPVTSAGTALALVALMQDKDD
jgi:hypothetical protein